MSSSEEPTPDEDDIPDVKICQERCEQFAMLTATDTACAQFFLQDRKWDLNKSVNAFFDAQKAKEVQVLDDGDEPQVIFPFEYVIRSLAQPNLAAAVAAASGASDQDIRKMKFITWNIDGLDDRSLKKRVKAVCKIINSELPDVVHLQEIIPEIYDGIQYLLPAYKCISGRSGNNEYFIGTLLRLNSVTYESHEIFDFPESVMGRNLLIVKAKIGDNSLTLLNTHLESTANFSAERKNQLVTAFKRVMQVDPGRTVLFAGDLNLRDKELEQLGGVPVPIEDLWCTCGKRPECSYTWDSKRNSNIEIQGRYMARCRFDRIYCRRADRSPITPKYFGLIGIEKIPTCGKFPSDHWGLVTHFDL